MSRSGYEEADCFDDWGMIKYRGMVASAFRGKRGIEFLRSLREALDAIPDKKLIEHELQNKAGGVCAIGAVGKMRGIDMTEMDAETVTDDGTLAEMFNISNVMVREIEFENDEAGGTWWAEGLRDENGFPVWAENEDGYRVQKHATNAAGVNVDSHGRTKESFETSRDLIRWSRVSLYVDNAIKDGVQFRRERGWKDV